MCYVTDAWRMIDGARKDGPSGGRKTSVTCLPSEGFDGSHTLVDGFDGGWVGRIMVDG